MRSESLRGLEFLGIELDEEANQRGDTRLSRGPTQALVIPTNEELAIARDTRQVLERMAGEADPALSEEAVERELAALSNEERRELVMLWAADPSVDMDHLGDRLAHKISKRLSMQALRRELNRLGLVEAQQSADTDRDADHG